MGQGRRETTKLNYGVDLGWLCSSLVRGYNTDKQWDVTGKILFSGKLRRFRQAKQCSGSDQEMKRQEIFQVLKEAFINTVLVGLVGTQIYVKLLRALLNVKLFVSTLAISVLEGFFLGIVLGSQSTHVSTSVLSLKSFPF